MTDEIYSRYGPERDVPLPWSPDLKASAANLAVAGEAIQALGVSAEEATRGFRRLMEILRRKR